MEVRPHFLMIWVRRTSHPNYLFFRWHCMRLDTVLDLTTQQIDHPWCTLIIKDTNHIFPWTLMTLRAEMKAGFFYFPEQTNVLTLIGQASWMLLESGGGGWISPHLLDHPKTLWKTKKNLFDFLKVHNELGKVTKYWTSRPLFSWRNGRLKKVRADSAPPPP